MAKWSEHDVNVLKEMYESHSQEEIINSLEVKRKWDTVRAKGLSLGIVRNYRIPQNDKIQKSLSLHKHCNRNKYQGLVYEKNEEMIRELNEIQKLLINEIQRYCEENGEFPNEKDMSNKRGYVSRTQFLKHFAIERFTDIHTYIYRVEEKMPKSRFCSKCNIEKELDESNFPKIKNAKFGFGTMCRDCINKTNIQREYAKRGIVFNGKYEDINPEKWWEYYYEGKIKILPSFCYEKESIIKIVRHVCFNILDIENKNDLASTGFLNDELLRKYKLYYLYRDRYRRYEFISMCFPEFDIKQFDMPITYYDDDVMIELISWFIKDSKLDIKDILNGNYDFNNHGKLKAMVAHKFNDSPNSMFVWYFSNQGILHPEQGRAIDVFDFRYKPLGFWDNRDNRIEALRRYCEDNGILYVINNTEELKLWVYSNFKQEQVASIFEYQKYYESIYDTLVDAYPSIKDNKVLFKWEWHQWSIYDEELIKQMLRELVLYRLCIDNPKDIPLYLTYTHMQRIYSKFNKVLLKSCYNNYFEWACDAFPEYAHIWSIKDFYNNVARDGAICGSGQEKDVYEYIKFELGVKYIEAIGTQYQGRHSFVLPKGSKDKWYCPDFVIEYVDKDGVKTRLPKPIYIEFYGMYVKGEHKSDVFREYKRKTKRKSSYYKSLSNIEFIELYPDDLNNSYQSIDRKFSGLIDNKSKLSV